MGVDDRRYYGEQRFVAYGFIGPRLHVAVFVERAGVHRLISLRKANQKERDYYESQNIDIEIEGEATDN